MIKDIEKFRDWYVELPILTYGEITDEYILDSFETILQWKKDGVFISDKIPEDKFNITEYWLLLGLLYNLIEYGPSPRGAWLNEKGEKFLKILKEHKSQIMSAI